MTLPLYITRRFLRGVLVVFLVVTALVALLSMVENVRVAANNEASLGEAALLTMLQIPDVLSETFPLILMLGALVAFLGLSRSSEMVIVRASGVSALKMLLWPVLCAFGIGVIFVAVLNPIVATTSQRAMEYRSQLTGNDVSVLSVDTKSLWLRQGLDSGQTVIQASRAAPDGTVLYGVRLHQFDPDNRLVTRIEAASATLRPGVWMLSSVRRWQLDLAPGMPLAAPENLTALRVATNLTRTRIAESFSQPEHIPFWNLPGFIRILERAGFSATRVEVYFQSELARPLLFAAMVLIGAGFSLRHVRFGQVGVMILFAVGAGFSLFFFRDIAQTLGENGDIPVLLAAWSPPAAATLLALALLLHLEDG